MSFVTDAYFRVFEPLRVFGAESREKTTRALRAARISMFPEWYLSMSYLVAAGVAILATIVAIVVGALHPVERPLVRGLFAGGVAASAFLATRLAFMLYPRVVAAGRARAIDAEFPSVVVLCYALARGGMDTPRIFRVIAEERETYGEISREFSLVIRDIEQLGEDMNSALMAVASTTPSVTLRGFFEGLVTMLNSGADPRDYFKRQAETQLADAELRMNKEVEQSGLLAESYVSGLLVLPLLLVVVLSVLAILGNTNPVFIPLIVFVMVPGGTIAFLVLLDILLPPDSLGVGTGPTTRDLDAGMDTLPPMGDQLTPPARTTLDALARELDREIAAGGERAEKAGRQRRLLLLLFLHKRFDESWTSMRAAALEQPMTALKFSGPLAMLVLVVGGIVLTLRALGGSDIVVPSTALVLIGLLLSFGPVAVFHEMRVHRSNMIESALPETLSKLSGFNERGVPLLRSFELVGRSTRGPLAEEFRILGRDVSWSANLAGALARMRARAKTRRLRKVGILFERGTAATGNLQEVLEIAASEASTSHSQAQRKRQAMMSYTVVVYVVFAVFLYVVYTVTDLLYGSSGLSSLGTTGGQLSGFATTMEPQKARVLYLHAVLVQAACCGLVAGKLGEGRILSGLKHAFVLVALGWATLSMGVM